MGHGTAPRTQSLRTVVGRVGLLAAGLWIPGCTELGASGSSDADTLPFLTLDEELRIGSADDPDAGFSRISSYDGVDVDRDGGVYVMETQALEIRVFSAEGQLLRTIGRRGEGPGEFQMPAQIGVFGDTVWALQSFIPRIFLYTREGVVLASSPPVEDVMVPIDGETTARVRAQLMGPDGAFIGAFWGTRGGRPTDTLRMPRVRFDLTGAVLDTIGVDVIAPPPAYEAAESVEIGGREFDVPRAPGDEPLSTITVDGRLLVDRRAPSGEGTATFTVTRIDLNGDTIATRTFDYRARRYPDAYLDTLAQRRVRTPATIAVINGVPRLPPEPENPDAVFRAIRAALSFPEFQPPIEAANVGKDGSIWLRWSDDGSGERRYIVLRPDLEPVGQLILPRSTSFGRLTVDTVWFIEPDEFDVPWLVKYRVR